MAVIRFEPFRDPPKTKARRIEVTRASGGSRTISGSTAGQGEAPAGGTGGAAG